jgi:5-enolpyruvylshikimate-3-phosphate synthase
MSNTAEQGKPGNPMAEAVDALLKLGAAIYQDDGQEPGPATLACRSAVAIYLRALVSSWFASTKLLLDHLLVILNGALDGTGQTAEAPEAPRAPTA